MRLASHAPQDFTVGEQQAATGACCEPRDAQLFTVSTNATGSRAISARNVASAARHVHSPWKVALLVLVLATLAACVSEPWGCGMGGACPALADVGGVRYHTTAAIQLVGIEDALSSAGTISQTNAPDYYAALSVFSVAGVDPRAVLVARSSVGGATPYVVLWGPDEARAWPGFCDFLVESSRRAQPECGAPRRPDEVSPN